MITDRDLEILARDADRRADELRARGEDATEALAVRDLLIAMLAELDAEADS